MHEVSLMESALEAAERHAKGQNATRIHAITLNVGALSGVVPDALEFAFEAVTKGTMAEGATLTVITIPLACYCAGCDLEFEAEDITAACPTCGEWSPDVRRGQELHLASLEVS